MKKILLTISCAMACSLQVLNAQQIPIAGKITDSNGNPIAGVTVNVKGTTISVTTNANGLFSINANQNAVLIISSVGFKTQEVPIGGRKSLTVVMESSEEAIEEVVVTALGIQRSER